MYIIEEKNGVKNYHKFENISKEKLKSTEPPTFKFQNCDDKGKIIKGYKLKTKNSFLAIKADDVIFDYDTQNSNAGTADQDLSIKFLEDGIIQFFIKIKSEIECKVVNENPEKKNEENGIKNPFSLNLFPTITEHERLVI